ncbi:hypothetical protein [Salinispora arenicola]|uniref:hypothetical protein n=1 Tax=Salinispora arenicola TaxID=168697 RepID=UPI000365CA3C|nr:hypothetical protein [Salinispora arenicola]
MIHWHRLDPAKVERAIKMLIVELCPGTQAIDGAGGDDGQDLRWFSPNGLVIVEVKSHADRLTASRKRKIKKSLENAARHEPVRWELVTPLDPSPAELQWFDSLRASYPGVELIWRDRAWLDGHFARREYLRRMVEGSEYTLLQRAAEFDREQAVLAGGLPDLADRVRVLRARTDDLPTGWKIDFATNDGDTTFTVSERFPGAAAHDPLRFTPVFDFPDDDPLAVETRANLDRALDYGLGCTVAQPYLQRIDVNASDETLRLLGLARTATAAAVELIPDVDRTGLPMPVVVEAVSADGTVIANVQVTVEDRTHGRRGIAVTGFDASKTFALTMMIAKLDTDGWQVTFNLAMNPVDGKYPFAVRPAVDVILALVNGNAIQVRAADTLLGPARPPTPAPSVSAPPMARLVVVLDELQRRYGARFLIPTDISARDLRDLEMILELKSTGRSRWPYRGINMHLWPDRLAEFLQNTEMHRGAILARFDGICMTVAGHEFDLGPVQFHCPHMILSNIDALRAADPNNDPEARWLCAPGEHLTISSVSVEPEVSVAA